MAYDALSAYDFIIGGGSAGSMLANRLSAQARVLGRLLVSRMAEWLL